MQEKIKNNNLNNESKNRFEELNKEATQLAKNININNYKIAVVLKEIRDDELWKTVKDGKKLKYKSFASYIENELKLSKRSVYDYINLIEKYGSDLENIPNISKLIPTIPLFNSEDLTDEQKKDAKKEFLDSVDKITAKEIREMVKEKLPQKEALLNKENITSKKRELFSFKGIIDTLPATIEDNQRAEVEELIKKLNNLLKSESVDATETEGVVDEKAA